MRYSVTGLLVVLVSSFVLGGCATGARIPDYDERLTKVKAGDVEVAPDEDTLTYEDKAIKIAWNFPDDELAIIEFSLKNKTDSQIKILWNEASYVDPSGATQEVFHAGMNTFEAETVMQPTVLPSNARTDSAILPRQHVKAGMYGAEFAPLVARDAVGEKTVRVILPLKYKDRVARYDFHFGISRVTEDQRKAEGTQIKKADKKKKKTTTEKKADSDDESAEDGASDEAKDTGETESSDEEQSAD
jgi:hypothetical protein